MATNRINYSAKFNKIATNMDYRETENATDKLFNDDRKKGTVFISHRHDDEAFAGDFVDFLITIGVPSETIFCSSLPGNDVEYKIDKEINDALISSVCNILLLSDDYYNSAYCLNECGIIWFQNYNYNVTFIPIGINDMSVDKMKGFVNGDYKLRDINNDSDIYYIVDKLQKLGFSIVSSHQSISRAIEALKKRYLEDIAKKTKIESVIESVVELPIVDDEYVLYSFIIEKKKKTVLCSDFKQWVHDNELIGIDVDNAFDIVSAYKDNKRKDNCLELSINEFKRILSDKIIAEQSVESKKKHQFFAINTLNKLIDENKIPDETLLLLLYMKENNTIKFGVRWKAKDEIANIENWEIIQGMDNCLSSGYETGTKILIDNNLAYPSGFTEYENPREYTLYPSLKESINNEKTLFEDLFKTVEKEHSLIH